MPPLPKTQSDGPDSPPTRGGKKVTTSLGKTAAPPVHVRLGLTGAVPLQCEDSEAENCGISALARNDLPVLTKTDPGRPRRDLIYLVRSPVAKVAIADGSGGQHLQIYMHTQSESAYVFLVLEVGVEPT